METVVVAFLVIAILVVISLTQADNTAKEEHKLKNKDQEA